MRNSSGVIWALLALVCAGLAITADVFFTDLIRSGDASAPARVSRVVEHRDDPQEIPIFGASKVEKGYIPEVLGPGFFNYGLTHASPNVTNLLVSFKLEENSDRPIVIDLNPSAFDDIGDVRNFVPVARNPQVKALLEKQGRWRWYYGIPGLRYFGSFDWYLKDALTDRFSRNVRFVRGYSHMLTPPRWTRKTFDQTVAKRLRTPITFGMVSDQHQMMLSLIRSAPQRKFILVLSPVHWSYVHGATGESQFRAQLAAFQSEPNVILLDFTRAAYPDRYFKDSVHLSPEGARVFSAQLRTAIEERVSAPSKPPISLNGPSDGRALHPAPQRPIVTSH